jgi:hypothetical protein
MSSPVIEDAVVVNMTFPEAIREIVDGEKVTRVEWDSKEEYGFMANELLMIHTKGKDHQWIVSEGDMRATDWITL